MKTEGALFIYDILVKVGFYGRRKEGFVFFSPKGIIQLLNLGRIIYLIKNIFYSLIICKM